MCLFYANDLFLRVSMGSCVRKVSRSAISFLHVLRRHVSYDFLVSRFFFLQITTMIMVATVDAVFSPTALTS
ncbi:hypothetical protein Tb09.160.2410 [Trypanosoma brucei brucei TREU927]|uniref:Uncharacterized protein n=1 Tax=Trypanosoma brucei brucei (strain 927/4 GUTat10.1) TaxID=185431 RepID=Q38FF2_TRYB2|nr:hypothetical protein Tb09.160.2410 [Trypanosoma brucei brucei TREU927]EAN76468.1 hypothetical protein Tb09.160.2410 [Trypanosoma brucei brucei TREU927]